MTVKIFPLGELQANCYLVSSRGEAVIIDPSDAGGFLAEKIGEERLKYILATHGHFDHLMGLLELKMLTKAPFLMAKEDLAITKRHVSTAKYFLNRQVDPMPAPNGFLKDNQEIHLGNAVIKIIHTPGHTPGSICLYCPAENVIFTGDTIFAFGGVGRTDFPGSSQKQLTESIKTKLLILPDKTIIYPGHGEISTIGQFKRDRHP